MMPSKRCRRVAMLRMALVAGLLAVVMAAPSASARSAEPDLTIGWTTWGDAEVVSKLATLILSQGMGYDVELTLADISVQYRGVVDGDLDAMLMSWQPLTHKSYLNRYGDDLVDLGPLYEGANLGLVVPAYISESQLASVADLAKPAVREKLDGKIQGIEPSAGIMSLTQQALEGYGLDYELLTGTGPKMAMEIGKAAEDQSWIVATGWRPHWKFAAYDLRYLEDPQNVYGDAESVHAVVRQGLEDDHPEVVAFLRRMHFSIDELEALMARAQEISHRQAAYEWIEANQDTVAEWMGQ